MLHNPSSYENPTPSFFSTHRGLDRERDMEKESGSYRFTYDLGDGGVITGQRRLRVEGGLRWGFLWLISKVTGLRTGQEMGHQ
ncbi:hypothetical protein Hdeb2414_s0007g00237261 [Helianthus debilis subsp. tardiflorus]